MAKLHLNYESEEMHASVEYKTLMNAEEEGYYDVETMKKIGDRINYNNHIAITKIPKKAFDYALNGKSAIDWVIERYKKTTDKDSLIENNPNDYTNLSQNPPKNRKITQAKPLKPLRKFKILSFRGVFLKNLGFL